MWSRSEPYSLWLYSACPVLLRCPLGSLTQPSHFTETSCIPHTLGSPPSKVYCLRLVAHKRVNRRKSRSYLDGTTSQLKQTHLHVPNSAMRSLSIVKPWELPENFGDMSVGN